MEVNAGGKSSSCLIGGKSCARSIIVVADDYLPSRLTSTFVFSLCLTSAVRSRRLGPKVGIDER